MQFRKSFAAVVFVLSLNTLPGNAYELIEEDMSSKNGNKEEELNRLYRRAKIIYNFILSDQEQNNSGNVFWGDKGKEFIEMFGSIIEGTYKRKDLRGLRSINNDFDDFIKGSSREQEINDLLTKNNL